MIQPYWKTIVTSEWKDTCPEIGVALKEIADSNPSIFKAVPVKYGFDIKGTKTERKHYGIVIISDDKDVYYFLNQRQDYDEFRYIEINLTDHKDIMYFVITTSNEVNVGATVNVLFVCYDVDVIDLGQQRGTTEIVDSIDFKDKLNINNPYCNIFNKSNLYDEQCREAIRALSNETNDYEMLPPEPKTELERQLSIISNHFWNDRKVSKSYIEATVRQAIETGFGRKIKSKEMDDVNELAYCIANVNSNIDSIVENVLYKKIVFNFTLECLEAAASRKCTVAEAQERIEQLLNSIQTTIRKYKSHRFTKGTNLENRAVNTGIKYIETFANKAEMLGYDLQIRAEYLVDHLDNKEIDCIQLEVNGNNDGKIYLKLKTVEGIQYYLYIPHAIPVKIINEVDDYSDIIQRFSVVTGVIEDSDIALRKLNQDFRLAYSLAMCASGSFIPSEELAKKLMKNLSRLFRYDGVRAFSTLRKNSSLRTFFRKFLSISINNKWLGELSIAGLKIKYLDKPYLDYINIP